MTGVLIQRGNVATGMHTQGESCVKMRAEMEVITFPSEGTPNIASNHQKLGETDGTDFLTTLRGNLSCQHLTLKLLASSTVRWQIFVKPLSLWYFVTVALAN